MATEKNQFFLINVDIFKNPLAQSSANGRNQY